MSAVSLSSAVFGNAAANQRSLGRTILTHIVRLMNAGRYGTDKTRDYLRRNLRSVMFHGAPLPPGIAAGADPFWFNPPEPAA